MINHKTALLPTLLLSCAVSSLTVTAAQADAGVPANLSAAESATIIVTGSRLIEDQAVRANPVVTISAQTLENAGTLNLVETLAQNPALLNSLSGARSSGLEASHGAIGMTALDLRGLGVNRTLTLVDGRRHVAGVHGYNVVDISSLPVTLLEGVDVMTGGASAVYGADAVSGVVNFRLKRDLEGLRAQAQTGVSDAGDAGQRLASLAYGRNFAQGRGNVTLAYEYREIDQVSTYDRAFSGDSFGTYDLVRNPADPFDDPNLPDYVPLNDLRYANTSIYGAVDLNFDYIADFTGDGRPYNHGTPLPNSDGLTQGGDNTQRAGYRGDLQSASHAHNVNLLARYAFSPAFELFGEAKYSHTTSRNAMQASYDSLHLNAQNPYLQERFGAYVSPYGALMSRDHADFGPRGERDKRETVRLVAGLKGEISSRLRYEASYTFGQTNTDIEMVNYRLADRYYAAVDAVRDPVSGAIVCRSNLQPDAMIGGINYNAPAVSFTPGANSGCLPLNLLGYGVADQAAIDWIMADVRNQAQLNQHVASAYLSGDLGDHFSLPGGPVRFVLGAEYRHESSRYTPDAQLAAGWLKDYGARPGEYGRFDVKEAFGEVALPLLQNQPFAHELSLGAALRVADYGTVGTNSSWNLNGTYAPVQAVKLRATYSQAVRAPNIAEIFAPTRTSSDYVIDPCDPYLQTQGSVYRAANCSLLLEAAGLNSSQIANFSPNHYVSVGGLTSGNTNLQEETARTWTAGVVLQPDFVPNLRLTLDWYDIRLKNAISYAGASETAALCVDQATLDNPYCANIRRANGTGFINGWRSQPHNVADFRTAGLDMQLAYHVRMARLGRLDFQMVGGYLDRLDTRSLPGAPRESRLGQAYHPKWNATADLTWSLDQFSVNYGLAWFSKTDRYTKAQLAAEPDIADPKYLHYKAKWQHDLQLAYDLGGQFRFYMGANNLFNQKPDIGSSYYPANYIGRYVYTGVKVAI